MKKIIAAIITSTFAMGTFAATAAASAPAVAAPAAAAAPAVAAAPAAKEEMKKVAVDHKKSAKKHVEKTKAVAPAAPAASKPAA